MCDVRFKAPHFCIDDEGDFLWLRYSGDHYPIERERIKEPDWISHLFHKMDYKLFGEFVAAFLHYCNKCGLDQITIDTSHFDVELWPGKNCPEHWNTEEFFNEQIAEKEVFKKSDYRYDRRKV